MSTGVISVVPGLAKKKTLDGRKVQRNKVSTLTPNLAGHLFTWNYENRSSRLRCSVSKGVLRNFAKFTGKHLCQSLCFNKVAGLRHRCFPVNFAKFLRTPFFTVHLWLTHSESSVIFHVFLLCLL